MPPRSRRTFSPARRGRRRQLVWATFDQQFPAMPIGSVHTADLLTQLELAGVSHLGITIMRTHVRLQLTNITVPADAVPFGLVVGTAADIPTRPDPNAENIDWMWRGRFMAFEVAGADVAHNPVVQLDVKARRRMQELDQRYLICFKNLSSSTAFAPRVWARTLVALP